MGTFPSTYLLALSTLRFTHPPPPPFCSVLLPGGATWFNASNGYADAGRHILDIAMRLNDAGHAMPLWGTCLGMELLAYLTSTKGDPRAECYSQRQALHLEFEPGRYYVMNLCYAHAQLIFFIQLYCRLSHQQTIRPGPAGGRRYSGRRTGDRQLPQLLPDPPEHQ